MVPITIDKQSMEATFLIPTEEEKKKLHTPELPNYVLIMQFS